MVHAYYHTYAYSLFFFLIPFSFPSFYSLVLLLFLLLFPCTSWCYYVLSFPPSVVVPCARWRTFLYFLPWWIFTILPLNCFCLGLGVLPNHPLVYQLPNHHYLPVLAVPHPITRQRVIILFVYSLWHFHPD